MNPWVPLAGTLGWNYIRHKRGRPTICSTTRRALPSKPVACGLLVIGFAALFVHYVEGYVDIDLSDLGERL